MATLKLSRPAVRATVPAIKDRAHYVVVRGKAVRYMPTGRLVQGGPK